MGFIDWLRNGIVAVLDSILREPQNIIDGLRNEILTAADIILDGIRSFLGIKKHPPSEKIRAALRQQWLNLAPGEKEIPGVEWEDEIYYETPK